MIDSVVLQLQEGQFTLREKHLFREGKNQRGKGFTVKTKFCSEYTKKWKKRGVYCPAFELPTRTRGKGEPQEVLEIQVSLQKLVHGTNLFEIDESDLDTIYKKLLYFLNDLGVDVTRENLEKAIVRRADFSKIVKLPDYLGRADEVIRLLARFDYKPQSEFRFREYSNGDEGLVIKFWNSTQGYAIYCKFGEILNQGFTKQELKLKKLYQEGKQPRNALKFELSLQRKDSFEAVVRRRIEGDKKKDFHLNEMLNREIAKAVLCDTFEKVFSNVAVGLVMLSHMQDNKLWAYLEKSGLSQIKQERLYYGVRMATKFGIAGTWEQLKLKHKGGSVARRKQEIALALQEVGTMSGNIPNLVGFLRAEHEKFEVIKPKFKL